MSQNESASPETSGQDAPLKRKRDLASLIDELVPTSTAAPTPIEALEVSRTEGRVKTAQYIQASLLLKRQSISAEALAPDSGLTPTELTELDFALAEGRIAPTEFVRMYNGGVSRQPATPEKMIACVDQLALYEGHLRIGSERVLFPEIRSVRYSSSTHSVNFVRLSKLTQCTIKFEKRPTVYLSEDRAYFQNDRHHVITAFGAAAAKATFETRLRNFFARLHRDRRLRLSVDFKPGLLGTQQSVFLTAAGALETCNVRVDLKEALEHGEVLLGVDYRSLNGISAEYRPHEIAVSERKKAWCEPMGGIVFTPSTEDPDIVHSAIAGMATSGNNLAARRAACLGLLSALE